MIHDPATDARAVAGHGAVRQRQRSLVVPDAARGFEDEGVFGGATSGDCEPVELRGDITR